MIHISNRQQSIFDEEKSIKEFKKESKSYRIEVVKYKKLNTENSPDFECRIEEKGVQRDVFIEVTKLLAIHGSLKSKESAWDNLAEKIDNYLKEKGYCSIDIVITFISDTNISIKKFEGKLKELLCLKLQNKISAGVIYIKNDEIANFDRDLGNAVQWILIRDHHCLRVLSNKFYNSTELSSKVVEIVKKKENRKYKVMPVWLIIYIDDRVSMLEDVNQISVSSDGFEKIFLQFSYWPITKNYPLFLIKNNIATKS